MLYDHINDCTLFANVYGLNLKKKNITRLRPQGSYLSCWWTSAMFQGLPRIDLWEAGPSRWNCWSKTGGINKLSSSLNSSFILMASFRSAYLTWNSVKPFWNVLKKLFAFVEEQSSMKRGNLWDFSRIYIRDIMWIEIGVVFWKDPQQNLWSMIHSPTASACVTLC